MYYMKLHLILFLLLSNIAFSQKSHEPSSVSFDSHLKKANKSLKSSQEKYDLTFNWDQETFILKSEKCEFTIWIMGAYWEEHDDTEEGVFKLLFVNYKKEARFEKKCNVDAKPVIADTVTIYFDNHKARQNVHKHMGRGQSLYKRGKKEYDYVSSSMTHTGLNVLGEKNKAKYEKMIVDYKKSMQVVLTEMSNDFSNVALQPRDQRDSSQVEYDIPSFNFPYCKTTVVQNRLANTITVKVRRNADEPKMKEFYYNIIEKSVKSNLFYFTIPNENNLVFRGYYPIHKKETSEIMAFYIVHLDDSGFDLIYKDNSRIAEQFSKTLEAFVSTDKDEPNNALLLPGSTNYTRGVVGDSEIMTQVFDVKGCLLIEMLVKDKQNYFKRALPKGIEYLKGFHRRAYKYGDRYVFLFKAKGEYVYMVIDLDYENRDEIIRFHLFKGEGEKYIDVIDSKEIADDNARDNYLRDKKEREIKKRIPLYLALADQEKNFKEEGYTVIHSDRSFLLEPNFQTIDLHFDKEDLKGFKLVLVVVLYDESDYPLAEPRISGAYGKEEYRDKALDESKVQKDMGSGKSPIIRIAAGMQFELDELNFSDFRIHNLTKGAVYVIAQ